HHGPPSSASQSRRGTAPFPRAPVPFARGTPGRTCHHRRQAAGLVALAPCLLGNVVRHRGRVGPASCGRRVLRAPYPTQPRCPIFLLFPPKNSLLSPHPSS